MNYLKYEIPVDKLPKFQATEGSSILRVAKSGEILNPIYAKFAKHTIRHDGTGYGLVE